MSGTAPNFLDQYLAAQGQPKAAPAEALSTAPTDFLDQYLAQDHQPKTAAPVAPAPQVEPPAEQSSMWKVILSGLAKGGAGFMDMVDLGDQAMQRAKGGFAPQQPFQSGRVTDIAKDAGAVGFPGSVPQTTAQRYAAAGAEGVGGGIPFALATGGVAPAISVLGQSLLGGLGGEAGSDITGGKDWGRLVGSMLGGISGGKAIDLTTKGVNAAIGNRGPITQAYHEAGVQPRMMAPITGGKTASVMQDVASGIPGGTGRMASAANETLDEFGAAVNKAADAIGGARTPQAAGEAIQLGAQNWLQNFATTSADKWNKFWQALPPTTQTPMTATRIAARGLGDRLLELPGMADALSTDQWKAVRQSIASAAPTVSVGTLKTLRTAVGQQLENAPLVGNPATGDLKRLYAAITEDIKTLAAGGASAPSSVQKPGILFGMGYGNPPPKAASPPPSNNALAAFTEANDYTRNGHQLIDNTVSKIFDKGNAINPETAYNWAIQQARSGDSRFNNLREVTETGANAAAGAKLRAMAAPAARLPGELAGGPAASPSSFNTAWNQLSPEGRAAMFSGVPNANALATVAGREAMGRGAENTSRTAQTSAYMDWLKGLAALAGGGIGGGMGYSAGKPIEGSIMGSLAGQAAATVGLPVVGRTLAQVMTSPTLNKVMGAPGDGLRMSHRAALAAALAEMQRRGQ